MALWWNSTQAFMGFEAPPVVIAETGDRRFQDSDWDNLPLFEYIKQTYLIASNAIRASVVDLNNVDVQTARKIAFFTQQFVDAMSPSNFVLTNPVVIRETIETGGKNLLHGLKHFLDDIDPKDGKLRTKMTDFNAFELGQNIAATPGKVVFQNELMQLIQYAPATTKVYRRPLLIVPPWINKYYVVDLSEKNSFIRWAIGEGHTTFVISWVNPDENLADKDFEDYVFEGPLAALDAIEEACDEAQVNMVGYCLGGTLLGATAAYMSARGDNRIQSATFFTSLLDFSEPGDLGAFIDEQQVQNIENIMNKSGYLGGAEIAMTFNLLRANDLVWSFVIHNYLLGRDPAPFDLLYWNNDSTRLPARMHIFYLRKMYLENALCEPGGINIGDVPIDLGKIEVPAFFVSALDDHIAPWQTTYLGAQALSGPVTFVLSESGHIAGVINPPGERAYDHFVGPDIDILDADDWFAVSESQTGSWWSRWAAWSRELAGEKVQKRRPGDGKLSVIENAPGAYAKKQYQ